MNRIRSIALIIGAAGAVLSVLGGLANHPQFFQSYLFAFLFWAGIALGCFGWVMLHHLVGGRWGHVTRRFFEAGLATLPLVAVLFLPLLFDLSALYGWARPPTVAHDAVLQHRQLYLNIPFFIARFACYFALWLWLAWSLNRGSLQQDATPDPGPTRHLRVLSAPGLVFYVLSVSFAIIDLVLSLEPDWFSTIFPILLIIGQTLAALSVGVLMLALFVRRPPFTETVTPTHFHHLGNLMLAFVMLWAYMAFVQLLIIWSGNLPNEIVWYLHRDTPGLKAIVFAVGAFHFALPFTLLLSRDLKHRIEFLAWLAVLILLAHCVDVYWLVAPSFHRGVSFHWLDLTILLGIGGFWIAWYLTSLLRHPLVPLNSPQPQIGPA